MNAFINNVAGFKVSAPRHGFYWADVIEPFD
jgi:hypothetical protein